MPTWRILVAAAIATAALAQSSIELNELRKELEALRQAQQMMQRDIEAIKNFLAGRREKAPFEGATLSLQGAPLMGDKDAKVTIVEFADYQCSFCARHVANTFPQIVSEYVKSGKVKYAYRNFPLEQIHPAAAKAAAAALCAGEQGKYWEMHARLFQNPSKLGADHLPGHADAIRLDAPKFKACLSSDKYAGVVKKDFEEGAKAGVEGTPTFFLGLSGSDPAKLDATLNLVGAQPFGAFKQAIDALLSKAQ